MNDLKAQFAALSLQVQLDRARESLKLRGIAVKGGKS